MLPHYDVHAGNGPYILMVHGMLSSRAQWIANIEALSAVARPVVLELWGHGRSAAPEAPGDYHPDAYVAAFEEIRKRLGAERWYLCGQSAGAGLTLLYALTHPERIIAQVFTNSNSALADAETMAIYRQNAESRAELAKAGGRAGLEKIPVHPVHAKRVPAEIHAEMLRDAALHKPEAFARTFLYTSPNLSVRERVRANRVPTLLISGEREARFRPITEFAAAQMPMTTVVHADAGHGVNIQAADHFNQAVSDFIRLHAPVEEA